jgi:hypothetical protein
MYKVWWKLRAKYSDDGYFYKKVEFMDNFKYVQNYSQAYDLLQDVKRAALTLGLGDMAEAGIENTNEEHTNDIY